MAAGASDLHLLPKEERVRVRIRVDGIVRELEPLRKDQGASVVARIKHATHEELEQAALAAGMKTLFADGLAKVAAGVTSLEEIHRILV